MSCQNICFHPRVVIIEHFDNIINQIDIKTEILLADVQRLKENDRKELNEMRQRQINKIQDIQQINLDLVPENICEEKFTRKCHEQTMEQIKGDLIKVNCILMEQPKLLNGLDLWVTDWFYSQRNLEFLK